MSSFISIAQLGKPYDTCWDWDSFPGSNFAVRANSWLPSSYEENSYRCLPDPMPAEFQMFNSPSPCSDAPCDVCKDKNSYGMIAGNGGSCPTCKKEFLLLENGYATN